MVDLHCHILPGVDDGSQSLTESVAMLDAARQMGITHIVCTPHVYRFAFDRAKVEAAFASLLEPAAERGVTLTQGFECNLKATTGVEEAELLSLCTEGTKQLLFEFPPDCWPGNWERILYRIQCEDIQIIVAHPERYKPIQCDFQIARTLVEMDCRLQVSPARLAGGLFSPTAKLIKRLQQADMVSFYGSDAHSPEDYAAFAKAIAKLEKHGGSGLLPDTLPDFS